MPRVLVAGKIHADGLAILCGRAGLELTVIDDPDAEIPAVEVRRSDAILVRYGVLSEASVREAGALRVVSRHGVGCDNLPVAALSARGIPVTIVGPVTAVSVAEQTFALLLAAVKKVTEYDRAVRQGDWRVRDSLAATELSGKRLLLLGFGRIAREVAKRARAFDMEVMAVDPFVAAELMRNEGVRKVEDWRNVLGEVDVLSLHLPLSPQTRNILDADAIGALKATAVVLNTARGGLIDEVSLSSALANRMARGAAGLDTFGIEPPPLDSSLLKLANVVLSPHSAALTGEAARRMGVVAARNVLAGLDGTLDPNVIYNRQALAGADAARREGQSGDGGLRP